MSMNTHKTVEEIVEDFNLYHVVTTDDGTEEYVWKPEVMRDWLRKKLTTHTLAVLDGVEKYRTENLIELDTVEGKQKFINSEGLKFFLLTHIESMKKEVSDN